MAQKSLKTGIASYSAIEPSTTPGGVEEAEPLNASGARVWTITLFTMIACLGSMLNGFVLGYSSATLVDLNSTSTETGEHGLSSDSAYSSLFGVSIISARLFMSKYLFELGLSSNWSTGGRPSCRLGVRPFWSQDWNDAWRYPIYFGMAVHLVRQLRSESGRLHCIA